MFITLTLCNYQVFVRTQVKLKPMQVHPTYLNSTWFEYTTHYMKGVCCQPHKVCNNADDIVTAIISNQENYQRLMEAFYPVNHGVPQFVSLIFFTNGTPISQPLCNQTPYAGMIMELNGEDNVYGTMWYASSANILATGTILNELGLMVPQVISGVFFKTNPIITAFPLVCLTVPYQIPQSKTLLQSDTLLVGMHALYVCTYICIYCMHHTYPV